MIETGFVYLIDDEKNVLDSLQEGLASQGIKVRAFSDPLKALESMKKYPPAVVVTDVLMPNLDGVELIKKVKKNSPEASFVVITAHASVNTAIDALRAGAVDFLIKPFKLSELVASIQKAMSQVRFVPATTPQSTMEERYRIKNLLSNDPKMMEIFQIVSKISKTNTTVLITGESGTGKEMMARSIHYNSNRKNSPFVSVNCAALPESLLESELFGYEKGAFTGAIATKQGLFEVANSGTFFMDEVGEIPPALQAKLLRVLQERTITHLGGVKEIPIDIRLVAATSRNLQEDIKASRFREDLFYRLNVMPIAMPPLRERTNDIAVLASHFLKLYSEKHQIRKKFSLTESAVSFLKSYQWPGNIRELENLMERVVTLGEDEVIDQASVEKLLGTKTKEDFSQTLSRSARSEKIDLAQTVDEYEKSLILDAIKRTNGNKMEAAKLLGITKQNLQYKVKKYALDNE